MKFLCYIFLLLIITACNSTKYLQDGEALVEKNEIEVEKGEKLSSSLKYDLSTLTRQQENGSFLFFPREWLYFNAKDTSRFFGRWIQKRLAEPPTIFSKYATVESAKSMRNYLISKGYYSAAVAYNTQFNKDSSKVEITYQIDPNELYLIDTVKIISQDTAIAKVLNKTKRQSLLKKGEPVSLDIYNNEVTRIVNYLKNNGYATFNRGFIAPLQADSISNQINLTLEILPQSDTSMHKSYRVGEIQVFPDYDPLDSIIVVNGTPPIYIPESRFNYVTDTTVNGVRFFQPNWKNAIKPKYLAREIRLRSGEKYSLRRENQTNNSLNTLGVFQFVSIRSEIDSLRDTVINYKIYLTRNKRLGFGSNLEFSYSDQNITRNRINLVGATASLSFKLRNAFKGAELSTNSVSFGMEFSPPSANAPPALNTIDFNVQSQLNFPRFIDYFSIWKWIGRKKKEGSLFHFLDQNANTQVVLGYNFLTRQNFYNYELFDFAFGYSAQLGGRHQLQLNHFGVNYFNPSISKNSDFGLLLDNNPFLRNSFGQQFFTGALLREVNYLYNYRNLRKGQQYSFSARLELSGVEVQTANGIYNRFALEETTFTIGSIDFSRYALLELDGRFTKTFNPIQSLALRFNFGIGKPFGLTNELPYVKQFFVGGPNSIRAFRAREVGPGGHCSPDIFWRVCGSEDTALDDDTPFYQTGNLKLEFNAEYRFDLLKIFSYTIEGALFAEAGNVWLTEFDENRANGQFRFTELLDENGLVINEAFYRQLALGTGFGVRLDLQYFLLRLDMGYPLHTPYEPNEAWVSQFTFEDVNYNLALNYPF
ncbi:MAG: BamA/TamA family outer membrane protein [Bacteroidota bacterium]